MKINKNFLKLGENYLFLIISEKVKRFKEKFPKKDIISLGIGDVTLPVCEAAVSAGLKAIEEMASAETFKGYGPNNGYLFLREKICKSYSERGVNISVDEVFISDGSKSDIGNISDIFSNENVCLIPDPTYPVYVDSNIMAGREITYCNAEERNEFLPTPIPEYEKSDLIYICSPNNPTGAAYSHEQLKSWVDFALSRNSVILFDSAYEAFVSNDVPHSIFEIEGARKCAIEFRSFSKTAGFTGMRCAYTIISKELEYDDVKINELWSRRQSTKFNGVPYVIQRAAEATLSAEGKTQIKKNIDYYRKNAEIIMQKLRHAKVKFFGGINSPYIWMKCPESMKSWKFFDFILEDAGVIGIPGSGFGKNGENFFRLACFGNHERTEEAIERLCRSILKKL
ncbi:MAG: LL-diaminopimelate aminotransferase [Oscillospiraceae bacterium]|nr:LL-diaminopimelate aminotransferase [Oscillospiraceae bacterium]